MQAIAWASCYLWPPEHHVYDALSELGEQLRKAGMQLVLFTVPGEFPKRVGFHRIALPQQLVEQGRLFEDFLAGANLPMGAATLREMIAIDRAFGMELPDTEAELLILRAIGFWERAFDIMQPSVVIAWGTSVPSARMMMRIGQRRQLPAYIMERGLVENTLSLSTCGQVALSNVNTSPTFIRPPEFGGVVEQNWNLVEAYLRKMAVLQAGYYNVDPDEGRERFLQEDPHPRILFLGNFDIGSGIALTDPALHERVGTWVTTSGAAAQHVQNALRIAAPTASLWCKCHPSSPFPMPPESAGVTVRDMQNINVHRLVQAADVVVTITSTTQALPLVYDKPLVTLGNGFFMGRNIAYEVNAEEQLAPALIAALARDGWPQRLKNGRALLAAMAEHDLFGSAEDAPTRLKIHDLATLIGRFATYVGAGLPSAEARYETYVKFRATAEGGRGAMGDQLENMRIESAALGTQINQLRVERNALLSELRGVMIERARLVFAPGELERNK